MGLEKTKTDDEQEIPRLQKLGDNAPDNASAEKFYGQATNLTVEISRMDAERESLEGRSHNLIQEIKKVGPDLKEARQKLHKEWIPYWIAHTTEFRPTTKMPQFRFAPGDVEAISAFIWQNSLTGPALDHQQPGNAEHGKTLLESRGCLACHSVGEGSNSVGGTFAANLSRVGEKDNYDTSFGGCTIRASGLVPTARMRSATWVPKICETQFAFCLRRAALALPE